MSSLNEARKALNQELEALRVRAEKIVAALDALTAIDEGLNPMPKETRDTSPRAATRFVPKKRAPKAAPAKKAAALPETGGIWFAELIEKPAVRKDIFAAAVKKAGVQLTKETTLQLSRRLDAALTKLVSSGAAKKEKTEAGYLYSKAAGK